MIILSHRGLWRTPEEKNTEVSFRRSFELGFGTETDVRDYCGELVISHDIANSDSMPLNNFLEIYCSYSKDLPLALNIKSDGLQSNLLKVLNKYKVSNYFVFDMSVPDALGYLKRGLKTFTRQSEFEILPSFYESAYGVWLDEFNEHWINQIEILKHLTNKKRVCIVSPELHNRSNELEWADYKKICDSLQIKDHLMMCTDSPEEANRIFNED
jgi:glycerophosphoryl diester phosphodiesterase